MQGNKTQGLTALLVSATDLACFCISSLFQSSAFKNIFWNKNVPKHVGGKEAQQNEAKQCKPATTGNALTQGQSDSRAGTLLAVSAGP